MLLNEQQMFLRISIILLSEDILRDLKLFYLINFTCEALYEKQ